jgi:hypothetical protein
MRLSFVVIVVSLAVFGMRAQANAACGAEYFAGVAERLAAIEARTDRALDAALARDRELEALVAAPEAPVRLALERPCGGETRAILARDVARARTLELWAHLLALGEGAAPVYPRDYVSACQRADYRDWQIAFIGAWIARLRPAPLVDSSALAESLAADTRYAHVRTLALADARALHIGVIRDSAQGTDAWLTANVRARDDDAAAAGSSCGPAVRLWALAPPAASPTANPVTVQAVGLR